MPLFIHLACFHNIDSFDGNVFISRFVHRKVDLTESAFTNILQYLIVFQLCWWFLFSTFTLRFGLLRWVNLVYIFTTCCCFLKFARRLSYRKALCLSIIILVECSAELWCWLLWLSIHPLKHLVHLSSLLSILFCLLLLILFGWCRICLHLIWLKFLKNIIN